MDFPLSAAKARIAFMEKHKTELYNHWSKDSIDRHLVEGEGHIQSANAAYREVEVHEKSKSFRQLG